MGRRRKPKFDITSKILQEAPEDKPVLHETCLRPDIYLDNYRFCNGCPHSITCKCELKQFIQEELPVKRKRK